MAELQKDLVKYYREQASDVPFVPLAPENKVPVSKLYVNPEVVEIDINSKSKDIYWSFINRFEKDLLEDVKIVSTYEQIFLENDIPKKNIYIQGEPGTGKSTFCTKLVIDWCNAVTAGTGSEICENSYFIDLDFLSRFAFLFFIPLREATQLCSVEEIITNILSDMCDADNLMKIIREENCLIILDGLDEWSHPVEKQCAKKRKEIPHRLAGTNCTFVTFSRPWKLNEVSLSSQEVDRCIEIKGVKNRDDLIARTLICLDAQDETEQCKSQLKSYDFSVGNLLDIPLITIQLVCFWNQEGKLPRSLCQLYSAMVDILLENYSIQSGKPKRVKIDQMSLPNCFRNLDHSLKHIDFLDSIGKLAHRTLFNENETQRVAFSQGVAELDEEMKDLAFQVGILTQRKIPSLTKRNSQISFLHKTFQEFFAAFALARVSGSGTVSKKLELILKRHNEGVDITQLFLFASGMCSEIASKLSDELSNISKDFEQENKRHPILLKGTVIAKQQLMTQALNESLENDLQNTDIFLRGGYLENAFPGAFPRKDKNALSEKLFKNNKNRIQVLLAEEDAKGNLRDESIHLDLRSYGSLQLLWVAGLHYIVSLNTKQLKECTFENVNLSRGNLVEAIKQNVLLDTLSLINCIYTDTLLDLTPCNKLQIFRFENESFLKVDVKICSIALKQLAISSCYLSKEIISTGLRDAVNLKSFSVKHCQYIGENETDFPMIDLSECSDLQCFHFEGKIGSNNEIKICGKALTHYEVRCCSLTELDISKAIREAKFLEKIVLSDCTSTHCLIANHSCFINLQQSCYLKRIFIKNCQFTRVDINLNNLITCKISGTSSDGIISVDIVGEAKQLKKLYMKWCSGRKPNNAKTVVDLTQCRTLSEFSIADVVEMDFDINATFLQVCSLSNVDLSAGNIVRALKDSSWLGYLRIMHCRKSSDNAQIIDLTQCKRLSQLIIEKSDVQLKFLDLERCLYTYFSLNGNVCPIQSITETLEKQHILKSGSLLSFTKYISLELKSESIVVCYDSEDSEFEDEPESLADRYLLALITYMHKDKKNYRNAQQ